MRKFSLFLLLATASAPAFAAIDEDSDRAARRAEREAAASERSEARSERAERRAAAASEQSESRPQRVERAERVQPANDAAVARVRERRGGDSATETQQRSGGSLTPRQRRIRTIPDTQPTASLPTSTQPIGGVETSHRRDYQDGNYQLWTNHWRNDRRYDWRNYRNRHRSLFRLGFYYDPFGWSYRRFNIGWNFWPSHYSSRYWLNDPWHYRLPPAYGPYRWVRYWDDALLVNIYTGEVVDVIHDFFW